jgi:uncharacterized protein (TIGR02246 family)
MQAKLFVTAFVAAYLASTSIAVADQAADEATIRANATKYVESYNRRDSRTMASMWSPEAVYIDAETGEKAVGHDAIAKQLDHEFAGDEDAKLTIHIGSIDFVSPNVAVEKGTAEVTYGKRPTEKSEYTAVHVRRDGKWLLDRVTEVDEPTPPPSNYEHLKDLEWMIGSWIDKDDNATIQTDCEWTKNRNFMTRSFAVAIGDKVHTSGMQIGSPSKFARGSSTPTAATPMASGSIKGTAGSFSRPGCSLMVARRQPLIFTIRSMPIRSPGRRSIARSTAKCSRTSTKFSLSANRRSEKRCGRRLRRR